MFTDLINNLRWRMNIQSYHWELILRKKEKLSMAKALQKRYINQSFLVWWKKEYLSNLREHQKINYKKGNCTTISVNDKVLVGKTRTPDQHGRWESLMSS